MTTDANGNATLPLFTAAAGLIVTATATSSTNDTSEFSACVTVPLGPTTFAVSNTNDSGPGSLRQASLDANAWRHARDHRVQHSRAPGRIRLSCRRRCPHQRPGDD